MTSTRDAAVVAAYRLGAGVARVVPARLGEPLAARLGAAARHLTPGRRRMATRHLRRASGVDADELDTLVRGAFASYGRYWWELFRLPVEVRAGRLERGFTIDGYEHVEAGLAEGRGVIVALPHLGGWEWAGAWFAARGHRCVAVAEAVEPPALFEWFTRTRAELGIDVVSTEAATASALVGSLRANRVVALVCDRDLSGDGVEVELLGERTTLPGGPATLALRAGAPVLPVAVYFRPRGGHHAVVRPPLDLGRRGRLRDDVARITQDLADELGRLVEAAPEQWHLMQPNWPSDVGVG